MWIKNFVSVLLIVAQKRNRTAGKIRFYEIKKRSYNRYFLMTSEIFVILTCLTYKNYNHEHRNNTLTDCSDGLTCGDKKPVQFAFQPAEAGCETGHDLKLKRLFMQAAQFLDRTEPICRRPRNRLFWLKKRVRLLTSWTTWLTKPSAPWPRPCRYRAWSSGCAFFQSRPLISISRYV